MEIDIQQLPVPDWGLACPRCEYPLRGLPEHRCPECGMALDMRELVKPWTRLRPPRISGYELPVRDFFGGCENCGHPLAGLGAHRCPECGLKFDPADFLPRAQWFVIDGPMAAPLTLTHLAMLLEAELLPHIAVGNRSLAETIVGTSAVGSKLLVPREFFFEFKTLLAEATQRLRDVQQRPGVAWQCPACGETNPGNFDLCWQCQTPAQHIR